MKVFLFALLGTLVAIALVISIVWWLIKRWIKKTFSPLAQALESFIPEPLRITLTPATPENLTNQAAFDAACADLSALGFVPAGTFATDDIDSLTICGFTHPAHRIYGAVYDFPSRAAWIDLVSTYTDGRAVTYSTMQETGVDQPPWSMSVKMPGKSTREVFEAFMNARPPAGLNDTPAAGFAKTVEDHYARTMDWRIARGVNEAEIRRVAKASNMEATDEEINLTVLARRAQRDAQVEEVVKTDYLKASRVPAVEWEAMEDRVHVIHDTMLTDEAVRTLVSLMGLTDDGEETSEGTRKRAELEAAMNTSGARAVFASSIALLPNAGECRKLTSTQTPVPADLWLLPEIEPMEEDDG